jgi:hypothetical protein
MKKNNLTKKICTGLGVLALGAIIGSGICYSKEINLKGHEIPDVSQANKLGDRYEDLTDKIEGKETLFDYYLVKNPKEDVDYIEIAVASVKGKIFAYGITTAYKQKGGTVEDFYTIYDEDGDGIFETKYTADETYNKHIEGSMLPEWVLN